MALPHGAVGCSSVRDCGISRSYSFTFWMSVVCSTMYAKVTFCFLEPVFKELFMALIMARCSPKFHFNATWYRVVMVSVTHLPCDYSNVRSDSTELAKDIQMP